MQNFAVYSSIIITCIILFYFAIRGVISLNKFGFNEIKPIKNPVRRTSTYLRVLFSLSFLLILNELTIIYTQQTDPSPTILVIYTLTIVVTAYIMHKLFFTTTPQEILDNSLPCFELDIKKNPYAKDDFEKICRFFNNEYNLFEESTNELLDLINPNPIKPIIFNIKKDKKGDSKNKSLFFLFFHLLKEKCIKTTNSYHVILTRFRQDDKTLAFKSKGDINAKLHYLRSDSNRIKDKIIAQETDFFLLLSKMETYHISFSKNCRKHLTKKYLERTKKSAQKSCDF